MNILVDIGHPAHVHFYRNFIKEMIKRSHKVIVTHREKEISKILLDHYNIEHITIAKYSNSFLKKFIGNIKRSYILRRLIKKHNIEIGLGIADYPLAWATKGIKCKALIFTDTEHVKVDKYFTYPFADNILTPSNFLKDLGKKQIRYKGYHELAYLHPNYFKPNFKVLKEEGISKDENFFIIRLVSWEASHDIGQKGIDEKQLQKLIELFKKKGRVLISSEKPLPKKFRQYEFKFAPEKIHDFLYFAEMYVGEGGTMATEAATLGTPTILINPEADAVGIHQVFRNKYKLLFYYENLDQALSKVKQLTDDKKLKNIWRKRAKKLINDHIDVTKFIVNFVENYLESHQIMREKPNYQRRFKLNRK